MEKLVFKGIESIVISENIVYYIYDVRKLDITLAGKKLRDKSIVYLYTADEGDVQINIIGSNKIIDTSSMTNGKCYKLVINATSDIDFEELNEANEGGGGIPEGVVQTIYEIASATDHNAVYLYLGNEEGYTHGGMYEWDSTDSQWVLISGGSEIIELTSEDILDWDNLEIDPAKKYVMNYKFTSTNEKYLGGLTGTFIADVIDKSTKLAMGTLYFNYNDTIKNQDYIAKVTLDLNPQNHAILYYNETNETWNVPNDFVGVIIDYYEPKDNIKLAFDPEILWQREPEYVSSRYPLAFTEVSDYSGNDYVFNFLFYSKNVKILTTFYNFECYLGSISTSQPEYIKNINVLKNVTVCSNTEKIYLGGFDYQEQTAFENIIIDSGVKNIFLGASNCRVVSGDYSIIDYTIFTNSSDYRIIGIDSNNNIVIKNVFDTPSVSLGGYSIYNTIAQIEALNDGDIFLWMGEDTEYESTGAEGRTFDCTFQKGLMYKLVHKETGQYWNWDHYEEYHMWDFKLNSPKEVYIDDIQQNKLIQGELYSIKYKFTTTNSALSSSTIDYEFIFLALGKSIFDGILVKYTNYYIDDIIRCTMSFDDLYSSYKYNLMVYPTMGAANIFLDDGVTELAPRFKYNKEIYNETTYQYDEYLCFHESNWSGLDKYLMFLKSNFIAGTTTCFELDDLDAVKAFNGIGTQISVTIVEGSNTSIEYVLCHGYYSGLILKSTSIDYKKEVPFDINLEINGKYVFNLNWDYTTSSGNANLLASWYNYYNITNIIVKSKLNFTKPIYEQVVTGTDNPSPNSIHDIYIGENCENIELASDLQYQNITFEPNTKNVTLAASTQGVADGPYLQNVKVTSGDYKDGNNDPQTVTIDRGRNYETTVGLNSQGTIVAKNLFD